jgi:hypothetical protein
MQDLSPPEMQLGSTCPMWEGFAMAPASAGAPTPGDCSNGSNPEGANYTQGQVLIGRQFYSGFTDSTDCACSSTHKQRLLSPLSKVVGPVVLHGVLILEYKQGFTFQVFEPFSRAAFPISGG